MITLIYQCGHSGTADGNEETTPMCPRCRKPIERVIAPAPRITGPGVVSPLKESDRAR